MPMHTLDELETHSPVPFTRPPPPHRPGRDAGPADLDPPPEANRPRGLPPAWAGAPRTARRPRACTRRRTARAGPRPGLRQRVPGGLHRQGHLAPGRFDRCRCAVAPRGVTVGRGVTSPR